MKKKISQDVLDELKFLREVADSIGKTRSLLESNVILMLGLWEKEDEGWEMDLLYNYDRDEIEDVLGRMGVKVKKGKK